MRYLTGFIFSLFIVNSALATDFVDLCNESCDMLVTFPDGGSIVADENLTLIFGTGGELNLGDTGTVNVNPQPLNLDFSTGGSLALAKGESITFDTGGSIVLGDGGNINYTNITINSSGGASLKAVGNPEKIVINNVTISGGLNITFEAKVIEVIGTFAINTDSALTLIAETGGLSPTVCDVQDTTNGVTLTAGSSIDTSGSCNTISSDLSLDAGVLTPIVIDPNATLTSNATITGNTTITFNPNQTLTLETDDITISDSQEADSSGTGTVSIAWLLLFSCLLRCRKISM